MQNLPTIELLRRAVRYVACSRCRRQPHTGGIYPPTVSRPCETECTIFANLPKLAKIAHDSAGARCAPAEQQMREQICLNCHAHISSGRDCDLRSNRECPLSIYLLDVIEPVERILKMRSSAPVQRAVELKGT